MSNIEISIIIPVFNSEKYLDECLKSVIHQTFTRYEIICVNDGSTDSSLIILEKYLQKYDNLKVHNKENEGPGSARNYGLKHAKGKYVLFLDSDDWLEENTLETLYETAMENDSELVMFNALEHYKNNKTKNRTYHVIKEDNNFRKFSFDYNNNINLVMNGYHIVCTKLHKLDFIKNYSLSFAEKDQFEDVLFHIKSMIYAKRISYTPEVLYHYRRTGDNSRQNNALNGKKSLQFFEIFEEVKEFLYDECLYEKFKINYYKFVINETRNIEQNIDNKFYDDFFIKAKKTFNKLCISTNDIMRLPLDYQYFYKALIESDNSLMFRKNLKKSNKKLLITKKVLKVKQWIKQII
ncbi:MAG: glycosyltransferase family 2 protein [Methanosphaera sp.]|nr:glycosyltransferase family 2 protein [Methanosphaera sp.]